MSYFKNTFAGDVEILACNIVSLNGTSVDITNQLAYVEVFEDIFAPFITARMVLKDPIDLPNKIPLVGEERVDLQFRTPGSNDKDVFTNIFYIYKMDGAEKSAEREQVYILHLMSIEGIVDLNKKLSKTFSGKVSTLVEKILKDSTALESVKDYAIEETSNSTKYVSNFWSPVQNIMYLTSQAQSSAGTPDYVFFENRGGFIFQSLETLYDNPIQSKFVADNYTDLVSKSNINGGSSTHDVEADFSKILNYNIPENFNYVDRIQLGMYGSQLISYDITTKRYSHVGFKPTFTTEKDKHLNKFSLHSNNLVFQGSSRIFNEPGYFNNFEGYQDVSNISFMQRRNHLISAAEASKLEITVPGRSKYTAGQKVTVQIPIRGSIAGKDSPEDSMDKLLSGNYLVATICHKISREKHECTMQLIKDSFIQDLDNVYRK